MERLIMANQTQKDLKRIKKAAQRLKEHAKLKGTAIVGKLLTHTANLIENIEKAVAHAAKKEKTSSKKKEKPSPKK
jgi:hypothetical protein